MDYYTCINMRVEILYTIIYRYMQIKSKGKET